MGVFEGKHAAHNCPPVSSHGSQKDFFQGRPLGDISKIFPWTAKSGEICFFPLEIKKTTLFGEIFKIQGDLAPHLPYRHPCFLQ